MLEPVFQDIINRIEDVSNSYREQPIKEAMQSRDWEFIFSEFRGWLVLYCSTKVTRSGYWIYPMLCPETGVDKLKETLPDNNFNISSAAYGHVMSGSDNWIEPCWGNFEDYHKSNIPLFFSRLYYGNPVGKECYFEFFQLITHPLDLHWSQTRNAYCVLNNNGEEIEKIKIINHPTVNLIMIRRTTLDKLLYLGKWLLIRYSNFHCYYTDHTLLNSVVTKRIDSFENEAIFQVTTSDNEYIEFRGAQIERPKTPKKHLLSWRVSDDDEEEEQKYISCIVYDFRNRRVLHNYSLDPVNFANYFIESNLPFETSPIFFKAEVLDKYKNNLDKYTVTERSISCRGAWYLQSYDINNHNQVHVYAKDLSDLPYKEQLYWLSYNEEPKGGISKRAFQTDFEGEFPDEASSLERLTESLEKLGKLKIGAEGYTIWSPKGGSWESASKGLYYINTENSNQWHDFIIALANVTNEGFNIKSLRNIASCFGHYDEKLGTLGLIKFILQSSGNEDKLAVTYEVLNDLQIKRSKGKAHGTWAKPEGSLIEDANSRLIAILSAIDELTEIFAELEIPSQP